jgi:hypothetical protein
MSVRIEESELAKDDWRSIRDPFKRGYWHGREIALAFLNERIRRGMDGRAAIEELTQLTARAMAADIEGETSKT